MSKVEFTWAMPQEVRAADFTNKNSVAEHEVFLATMPVKAMARWNKRIPEDWDDEGKPLSYRAGYELHVLPGQVNSNPESLTCIPLYHQLPEEEKTVDADVYFMNRDGGQLQIAVEGPLQSKLDRLYSKLPRRNGYSRISEKEDKAFFEQNPVSLLDVSSSEHEDREKLVTTRQAFADEVDACVSRFLKEFSDILDRHA